MDNSFHNLLLLTETIFHKKIVVETTKLGLLPGQGKILDYLYNNNGCEQRELSRAFFIEPATITGIIQRMETANLLIREYRNGNKKTNYVSLTEKGFETAKKVQEIFKKAEEEAFNNISEKDLLSFMTTLKKINNNIITKECSKNE